MNKIILSILCIVSLAAATPAQAAWYDWLRPSRWAASFSAWLNTDKQKLQTSLNNESRQKNLDLYNGLIELKPKKISLYESNSSAKINDEKKPAFSQEKIEIQQRLEFLGKRRSEIIDRLKGINQEHKTIIAGLNKVLDENKENLEIAQKIANTGINSSTEHQEALQN